MTLDPTQALRQATSMSTDAPTSAEDAREVAREFETVLVKQFVSELTKQMFNDSLAGDDGPGWMNSQKDQQRDQLTDMLTNHLVEAGAFKLDDLLLRQWKRAGLVQDASVDHAPELQMPTPPSTEESSPL